MLVLIYTAFLMKINTFKNTTKTVVYRDNNRLIQNLNVFKRTHVVSTTWNYSRKYT